MADYYSDDDDLRAKRPQIDAYLPSGQTDWRAFHLEAKAIIDRHLDVEWYRQKYRDWQERAFDPNGLLHASEQLKRLSTHKTLGLIFAFLDNGLVDSPYARLRDWHEEAFALELASVLTCGLDYDRSEDGGLSEDEVGLVLGQRRLERC